MVSPNRLGIAAVLIDEVHDRFGHRRREADKLAFCRTVLGLVQCRRGNPCRASQTAGREGVRQVVLVGSGETGLRN
jgi:hypothetical protein